MRKQAKWICFCIFVGICILMFAQLGSKAATVMAESAPIERKTTIVIDAGHGGEDGGAASGAGILESFYNLSIALRLEQLFHLLGMDTRMIRSSDISVYTEGDTIAQKKRSDLKERVRVVNETDHALLVSIHQNHFSDQRYSGAQVFFADVPGSKALAKRIQESFVRGLRPANKRDIKKADGIYLMEHIQAPGVLIECGFLSNPQEEALLRDGDYQKKICCIIAAAVKEHVEQVGVTNT